MAKALYLSKLNVNGQEYQIKDANAATTEDLNKKQNVLENYSEAKYPVGGGRSLINVSDGKICHSSISVSASESADTGIKFETNNGGNINTLTLDGDGLNFNHESVLVESDLADKVGYADYDSKGKEIVFYESEGGTVLFSIDATDFIKDGMVSDVAISNGNLVITFNTDAGQEPISIALTDIFNPANYYNKTEVDGKLDLKANASNVYTKSEADGKFLTEHQSLADYPTIETMNTALGQKANVSDIYTQTEIDNKLAAKADASNVYTKAEVDTQSETTAQALSNINTQLAAKANSADLATVATSGSYNDLTDKPVIPEGAVVDAALSDTSENPVQNKVVKGAIDEAKAYYISFATIATTGITDEDWDGIVAAIDAHRPIYAGYPKNDGGILYYGVECMNKNGNNTQIILTSSDDSSHYFYTFTKNGSNDYSYTVETRPYTTAAEKDAWNAKSDFSGSYKDLTDKPTIPTQTLLSVTGETLFISNNGYSPE